VTPTARRTAGLVAVVGAIAFGLLAWWLVPWDPVGRPVTPVPAHEVFSPAEIARAESYARWARTWGWGSLVLSLVVACWLGFTTAGERLVARLPGPRWLVVVLAVAAFELAGRVVTLPFAVALQQLRLDAGLATQAWGEWARDVAVAQLIIIGTTSIAMVIVITAAARWRRAWPVVVGVALAGFVLFASFVYPLLVEPLFNRFTSLPDGSLRTQVLELADREGVRVDDVLVADASRRTTSLNAYVSGYGSSRRVVLYDTLVEDAPEDQALSVVAHELAHARHDDPLVGTMLGAAGALVGVGVLGMIIGGRASDPRRLPRVLALLAVAMLVSSPVQSGISRLIETRADVDALAATEDPDAFVGLHRRLALRSLADPSPPRWSQWFFGTHPTVLDRIGMVDD
jgi:STE24 endopeptidase